MRKNLFEAGVDVDVEGLMSRLRETTKHPGPGVTGALSMQQLNPGIKELQPQQLDQEIQAGSVHSETFNQIPLKTRGSKIRIERPIKKFLKWLVHWNTKDQVEFNKSVIRSLGLIAEDLHTVQENLAILDDSRGNIMPVIQQNLQSEIRMVEARLRKDLDRNTRDTDNLKVQVGNYLAILEAGRMNLTSEVVRQKIQNEMGVVEARLRDYEARLRDYETRLRKVEARFREDMDRNIRDTGNLRVQVTNYLAMVEAGRVNLTRLEKTLRQEFGEEINRYTQVVREETRDQNETLVAHSSDIKSELTHQLDEFKMRTLRLERIARNTTWQGNSVAEVTPAHRSDTQVEVDDQSTNGNERLAAGVSASPGKAATPVFDYFLFEHHERGPASEIKRRQSIYLDLFRGKSNVVDLGCGRGEFVELLVENGINVSGVDHSEDMVAFCRDRGLPVVQADIFGYLTAMPDEKLDGIFLAQVVEHFSPEQVLRLVSLCAAKLQPGGVIVAETLNTNCSTALSNFYLDPTHVRPVPPELLKFMIEQQGFEFQTFRFSSPVSDNEAAAEVLDMDSGLAQEGNLYQDYAVIALRLDRGTLEPNAT